MAASIPRASPSSATVCFLLLTTAISAVSLSDLVEDKVLVCLFVSVSCLLLSSSSHCVVSTSEKRETKKRKEKKSSMPVLKALQNPFSDLSSPLHVPVCPPRLPSVLLPGPRPSSSRPTELLFLSPHQPNHSRVAAASRPPRTVSTPCSERTGGSPYRRHRGLPLLRWFQERASMSV